MKQDNFERNMELVESDQPFNNKEIYTAKYRCLTCFNISEDETGCEKPESLVTKTCWYCFKPKEN